ncbi:MAG TPA: PAS domain S-box protein, partial [Candidatus Cryosericum sp.]
MIDKEIRSGEAAVVQKRSEEALASSLSLLKATMESTADGLLVVDLAGRITLWNHKFADMWQIPEELLSKHLDELALNYVLQKMAQPEAFLAKVRELYEQPEASSNDQLDLADGRIFGRYSQPQRIGDDVVGRVWSFFDITERKQAEAQLRQSQKMEAIGTLAGGIAHDFNNMLTGILGNIALMRSSLPPADPLLENLNVAETSARQAADLTKGLLAFSRRTVV